MRCFFFILCWMLYAKILFRTFTCSWMAVVYYILILFLQEFLLYTLSVQFWLWGCMILQKTKKRLESNLPFILFFERYFIGWNYWFLRYLIQFTWKSTHPVVLFMGIDKRVVSISFMFRKIIQVFYLLLFKI